jgi:hypothetical protein
VILVDTVDLLLRGGEIPAVLAALLGAAVRERFATLITCRVREARILLEVAEDYRLTQRELDLYDETHELPAAITAYIRCFYTDPDVQPAEVESALRNAVAKGVPLREICRSPLALRMFFELADGRPPDLETDTVELYDRYWTLRVYRDRRHGVSGTQADVDVTPPFRFRLTDQCLHQKDEQPPKDRTDQLLDVIHPRGLAVLERPVHPSMSVHGTSSSCATVGTPGWPSVAGGQPDFGCPRMSGPGLGDPALPTMDSGCAHPDRIATIRPLGRRDG